MKHVKKLSLHLLIVAVGILVQGKVCCTLWAWFIAGTFHLPALTFFQAVGLIFFGNLFTAPMPTTSQILESELAEKYAGNRYEMMDRFRDVFANIIFPLMLLLGGWAATKLQ
jgi:hypothetical protein